MTAKDQPGLASMGNANALINVGVAAHKMTFVARHSRTLSEIVAFATVSAKVRLAVRVIVTGLASHSVHHHCRRRSMAEDGSIGVSISMPRKTWSSDMVIWSIAVSDF